MSIDFSYYLGPWVECYAPKKVVTREKRTCPVSTCPCHRTLVASPFCAMCGHASAIESYQEEADGVDYQTLCDAFDQVGIGEDELVTRRIRVINGECKLPNRSGPRKFHFDSDDLGLLLEQADINPEAEIAWFETSYAKHLTVLRKLYTKVTVRWSLFAYVD